MPQHAKPHTLKRNEIFGFESSMASSIVSSVSGMSELKRQINDLK